ncbi:Uncharacterized spore protein YtfJ [Lachnospiraceae bacterium NK3A20]|nr:Uncharacterized spore protein YtfJ [Lachnospiraceae bacterium NK3A20]
MAENNNITNVIDSLMKGVNGVLTSKTVVGQAITVGDTILIPLSDITIGCGAGSNSGDRKDGGMGGFSAKMSPTAVLIIHNGNTKVVNIKDTNNITRLLDMVPEVVDKMVAARQGQSMMGSEEAVENAFPEGTRGAAAQDAPSHGAPEVKSQDL